MGLKKYSLFLNGLLFISSFSCDKIKNQTDFKFSPLKPQDSEQGPIKSYPSRLYPSTWKPGDKVGDDLYLQDYSYAGYKNSVEEIDLSSYEVINVAQLLSLDKNGVEDSSQKVNNFISSISDQKMKMIRLHFSSGKYLFKNKIEINRSNVIISGDGSGKTFFSFKDKKSAAEASIAFTGKPKVEIVTAILEDLEIFSFQLSIDNAHGFKVGDDVEIEQVITDRFIKNHQMDGFWGFAKGQVRTFFRRKILAIDSNLKKVTLDVPHRYILQTKDQLKLKKVSSLIENCGLINLSVSDASTTGEAQKANRVHLIKIEQAKNCMISNVSSFPAEDTNLGHVRSNGLLITQSKQITVDNVHLKEAQNINEGGNGYLFEISQSSEILIKNSTGLKGRHNFIINWDFNTNGCVFSNIKSSESKATNLVLGIPVTVDSGSEFHHALAMANLIENSEIDDKWSAVNRGNYSSGAGHSGSQNVFWGIKGRGKIESYQYKNGYIIGTENLVEVETAIGRALPPQKSAQSYPDDYTELIGEYDKLYPKSLFLDQLKRRFSE